MGRSNSALTPEGVSTAKQVARLVKQQQIRTVFSSPLDRARLSAQIYTDGLGIPILVRDAMAELCCGEWEGKLRSEVGEGFPLIRTAWSDKPPGGESYADGEARVAGFIEEITSANIQYPILVVGHASVNRVFLKLWLGLDQERVLTIKSPHDTIYLIEGRQKVIAKSVTGIETEGLLFHLDRLPSHEGRGCR